MLLLLLLPLVLLVLLLRLQITGATSTAAAATTTTTTTSSYTVDTTLCRLNTLYRSCAFRGAVRYFRFMSDAIRIVPRGLSLEAQRSQYPLIKEYTLNQY